jgi:hypothetical protein
MEAGAGNDARPLARQIMLLLDGSFAVVLLHRDPSYMETAADAAAELVKSRLTAPPELDSATDKPCQLNESRP